MLQFISAPNFWYVLCNYVDTNNSVRSWQILYANHVLQYVNGNAVLGLWPDFKMISQNVPFIPLYQNCQNDFALLNKMVTRAKNRKTFK